MQHLQILGVRRNLQIFLLEFTWHVLQTGYRHRIPEPLICAIAPEEGRCHDELAHDIRMPDRHLQHDGAAIAETEEIRFFDLQVVQQRGGVVG